MAVKHDSAATPWKQTKVWKRLAALAEQNTAAENVLAQLTLWLPKIDAVLHSGATQPKDFTLHDDAHALQVAQRMDQILTDTSRDSLSCYELALLLLSGWLHDIGMVPEVARFALHPRRVVSVVRRVVSGERRLLHSHDLSGGMEGLRRLFDMFEQRTQLLHLFDLSNKADGVQIFIGGESQIVPLDEFSLVTAPYQVNGQIIGTLGVIGPTRMAYDRVIPIVDLTAKLLSSAMQREMGDG